MKKVAFILFGQVKNYNDVQHAQFTKNVLSKLKNFEIDFYLTTSKSNQYISPRNNENYPINHASIFEFFDFKQVVFDDISNKLSTFERFADYLVNTLNFKAWGEHSLISTINSLKQIYSLNYFYNLFFEKISNYDYFILSRSDLFFTHELFLPNLLLENIYVPDWGHYGNRAWYGGQYRNNAGCNDRFCIITCEKILQIYCNRYNSLELKPEPYHAEIYLQDQLLNNNIKFKQIKNFKFRFLRSNNIISSMRSSQPDLELTKKYYK